MGAEFKRRNSIQLDDIFRMGIVNVSLSKQSEDFHFVAKNEMGFEVHIDDATAYRDGKGHGVGPMQMLIMALGGCSGVDVMSILKKSRSDVTRFDIEVTGSKPDGASPSIYEEIHIRFSLDGNLTPNKVNRAVQLSLEKYCSVAATLIKSARIRYDYVVNGELYDGAWLAA